MQVDFDEDLDDEQDLACYRLAEILTILNERRGEKARHSFRSSRD